MPRAEAIQSVPQATALEPAEHMGTGRITDLSAFPLRLGRDDMLRIFEIKQAYFYRLLQRGKFDRFEILPRIGRRAWSRHLVQDYIDGAVTARKFAPMGVVR